ncbi:MAG TPA: ribonuclease III domain-containing protein [Clostridia bacterium]|jgi:ribonuclease-3 family protein|nr:MAG: Mini-ribonuclease 3 [Firmicutes bacterium ADurb.Bin146]HOD93258.1 ribonuclease III domain-containing protein [Clostridia bacterium]HQM39496.1 ribonuclease III domain-containing protein [Clostridia bacterium]
MFFKDLNVKDIADMPVLSLAYIGDAVYDLYVREHLLVKGCFKPLDLHKMTVAIVNAKSQKHSLMDIMELLDEKELNLVQRGRNAKSKSKPKNADAADYSYATALEVLVGYLYINKEYERLDYLLGIMLGF